MKLIAHIDGGSRGNPGPAAAGVVLADADDNTPVHEAGYYIGITTNNVAEYQGLLNALKLVTQMNVDGLAIYSDSQLMVRQILGEYRVKSDDLRPLFEQAKQLLSKVKSWSIHHVMREKNKRADELANLAMDAKRDVIVESAAGFVRNEPAPSRQSASEKTSDDSVPRWTVQLLKSPGKKCPARCQADLPYVFGPSTPAGFCVFAAEVVFASRPLSLHDHKTVTCPRCEVPMRISPLSRRET